MSHIYQVKNNKFTFIYALLRVLLGGYLVFHAGLNIAAFDAFYIESISYTGQEFLQYALSCIVPFLPLIEVFIGVLLLMGMYTDKCLKWSIIFGVLVILFLHIHNDYEAATHHLYLLVGKILLFSNLYYNRFSVDYYHLWQVTRDIKLMEDKFEVNN